MPYVPLSSEPSETTLAAAHGHSSNHRREIEASRMCGCYHCLATFPAMKVEEWIDGGETARCPRCGVDSVIGDASGFPIHELFLEAMRERWFR